MGGADAEHSLPRMLGQVWAFLSPRRRVQLVALQLLSVFMGFSTLVGIAAIVPFFTVLTDPEAIDGGRLLHAIFDSLGFESRRSFVLFLGFAFIGVVILANAVNLYGSMALHRFSLAIGRDFHVALYDEYLHRDYPFHLRSGAVTLANNVINETSRMVSGLVQGGLSLSANLLTCLLIFGSIILLNPVIALAIAALFLASYTAIYFTLRERLARRGRVEAETWDARMRTLHASFGAIRDILVRGAQAPFRDTFVRQSDFIVRVSSSVWAMSQAPRHLLECVMVTALVGAALWLSRGAGAAQWLTQLGFLGFAAYRLLPSVQQAFVAIARIRAHRSAFANIAADLRLGLAAVRPPEPEETLLAEWRGRPSSCVALREISFRYSDHTPLVLDRASAEFAGGRITGLVGQNGAGKSTLADLLLGLLRPTCGNIVVDGVTLGEREVPAWRATVAYVPQQIVLLDATLVENIAFAVPAGEIDPDRVHAAARAARLDALIAGHPDGLDQRLGEHGVHLSAGQRQRVGIARALYHGASMLVLDEATSALDAATERDLIATLRALRGEVTVVIIAHHESTLRVCDEIYELAGGTLLARGGFDEWRDRTGSRRRVAMP